MAKRQPNERTHKRGEKDPKITVTPRVGAKFRAKREELGLSTRAMSKKALCSNGTISNIETGKHQVKTSLYLRVARVLFGAQGEQEAEQSIQRRTRVMEQLSDALSQFEDDELEALAEYATKMKSRTA